MAGGVLACGVEAAAQQPPPAQAIYSCVDAKGRRITSDRPNMECLDRPQDRYGATGTPRGRLGPSLTAEEQAREEEKARREDERRARDNELKRRDRVLVSRYPDDASHRRERDDALSRVGEAQAAGERRLADLRKQREDLAVEEKSTGTDAAKAGRVLRAIEENEQNLAAQRRLLAAQADERQRITRRFDEELARLKVLWAQNAALAPAGGAGPRP